jgi:hypothetical protein
MKNNLLTEIKNIKNLMGLNEISNQEAEKQLEDAGYTVYNRTELKTQDDACGENTNIKCIQRWLDTNGIDSSRYRVGKHRGLCYISTRSTAEVTHTVDSDTLNLKKKTLAFWENGDITYIRSFDVVQTGTTDTNIKYSQVQFKGKYECNGSDLKYENLKYLGVYKFGSTSRLITSVPNTYMVKKSDGTDDRVLASFAVTNRTMAPGDFNEKLLYNLS